MSNPVDSTDRYAGLTATDKLDAQRRDAERPVGSSRQDLSPTDKSKQAPAVTDADSKQIGVKTAEKSLLHAKLHNADILAAEHDALVAAVPYYGDTGADELPDIKVELVDGEPRVTPAPPARPGDDASEVEWAKWHAEMERRGKLLTAYMVRQPQPFRGGQIVEPSPLGSPAEKPRLSFENVDRSNNPLPGEGTPGVTQVKP